MKYVLRSNFLVLAFALLSTPCVLAAPGSADGGNSKSNVFSVPEDDNTNRPRFANSDGKPNLGPKEHVPGWQEIKIIPSLTGERRKLVQELFNKGKSDAAPLQDEMKQIRSQIQQQAEAAAAGSGQDNGAAPVKQTASSGQPNPAGQDGAPAHPAAKGKPTPEQKVRMAQIRVQLQEIRAKTWDDVKAMLTEEDQHQLALMREGKLLPDNLQRNPAGKPSTQSATPRGNTDAEAPDDSKAMQEN